MNHRTWDNIRVDQEILEQLTQTKHMEDIPPVVYSIGRKMLPRIRDPG